MKYAAKASLTRLKKTVRLRLSVALFVVLLDMAGGLVVGGTGGDEFEVEVFDQGEDFGGNGGSEIELFHIFVVLFSGAKI